MTIITRFAPSPTGYLHVGNVRTALINYLYSKANSGKFMLRMDDTDLIRSKESYANQIIEDLKWLGFDWDIFAKQSDRLSRYDEIKKRLIDSKRLYPCYETQEDLEIKRKMQLKIGMPPIYDRSALKISIDQRSEFEKSGRNPHYRFMLNDAPIVWKDGIRGDTEFEGRNLSDPILIREDMSMTYILTSVVDDIDFCITDIIRGDDHVSNTAIQIQIFEALGANVPNFAHLARIKSSHAEISKRTGGFDIKSLREEFIEAMSINNLFAKIGSSESINIENSLQALTSGFSIKNFSRSPATYDRDDLFRINHKIIANYQFDQVRDSLKEIGLSDIDEEFWLHIRNNLALINDSIIWFNICRKELTPIIADEELLSIAIECLPDEKFDDNSFDKWICSIKNKTTKRGRELFMPLRLALSSIDNGPELKFLLPLIGREKSIKRLSGKTA